MRTWAVPQWIGAETVQSWNEVSLWIFAPNKVTHFPGMAMTLMQLTQSHPFIPHVRICHFSN